MSSFLSCFGLKSASTSLPILQQAIRFTVEDSVRNHDSQLRQLSLDAYPIIQIHNHPELGFQEVYACKVLTSFLDSQGFHITRSVCNMETAFTASFKTNVRKGKRIKIGLCSEMDALPEIGHACGHNLIAIAGVCAALALKEAALKHKLPVQITLFGTPAEEGGGGKVKMANEGAFDDLDICLMLHPDSSHNSRPTALSMQWIDIHFIGKAAHAAASPWDGVNALDAMCQTFTNISHLRQQLMPSDRVHGIITNGGSKVNIIPDLTSGKFIARAQTQTRLNQVVEKVVACMTSAAEATGSKYQIEYLMNYYNLISNPVLADLYQREMEMNGVQFPSLAEMTAEPTGSTDFGNVSHIVPGLQPFYATGFPDVDVHTEPFTEVAQSIRAHRATMLAAKSLACTALTVVCNPSLIHQIRHRFENDPRRIFDKHLLSSDTLTQKNTIPPCSHYSDSQSVQSSTSSPIESSNAPPPPYMSLAP